MRTRQRIAILTAVALGLAGWTGSGPAQNPTVFKIGMLSSMFRDVKPAMFTALAKPFHSIVHTQTGITSELVLVPTPDELRQKMVLNQIQFGVFHGFEFAWMQQKSPTLQPIMVVAPVYRPLKVFLVVHESSTAKSLADLKGQTLALPVGTREHTRLYLERACLKEGMPMLEFFGKVTNPPNAEEALHDVADNNTVQATAVDVAGMECFQARNPGRFKRVKVIATSDPFPESVVALSQGAVNGEIVRRFKEGMANANGTPLGRQLLSLWAMTGFQPVPANYAQQLAEVARRYPAPDVAVAAQ